MPVEHQCNAQMPDMFGRLLTVLSLLFTDGNSSGISSIISGNEIVSLVQYTVNSVYIYMPY